MIETFGPLVVGIALVFGGLRLLVTAVRRVRLARNASQSWPSVSGVVLKSSKRQANFGSEKSRNPRGNSYLLDFEYEYAVSGKTFRSTSPLFFSPYQYDDIQAFISQFPAGRKVSVYYDPKRHNRAVVDKTLRGKVEIMRPGLGASFRCPAPDLLPCVSKSL
ncbi:DUF3592 domain-containing protein [Marinobacter sp. SS13-12]|uniref:DUF3592 domain-containing protein n=1 Tax=Marinobacter sp. SS13-12 TaxID=3050451 RepID=UPI002553AFD8|nr:DUF3592 domain-containing protein [Marinobacter sp. SS13-12]MDK8465763.1 DUF3592 domain-containing protein [Marinobacter sp. SS13-12]